MDALKSQRKHTLLRGNLGLLSYFLSIGREIPKSACYTLPHTDNDRPKLEKRQRS